MIEWILSLFRSPRSRYLDQKARELYDADTAYWGKYGPEFCLPWNDESRCMFRVQAERFFG